MGTRQGLWDLFFLKEGFGFKGLGPLEFRVQGLERKRERERERARERERERQRETDRQTDGRTDGQTDRQRPSKRERERERERTHSNTQIKKLPPATSLSFAYLGQHLSRVVGSGPDGRFGPKHSQQNLITGFVI